MTNLQKLQEIKKLTNDQVLLEYINVLISIELEYES
jgi:hypothetical protein